MDALTRSDGPALVDTASARSPEELRRARALHAGARTLVALATQLRRAVVQSPDTMKHALVAAVARFERDLGTAGWDERGIAAASYILCVWLDEVVADTPWGSGGAGLLERFHGERDGGERVLRLLSLLAEKPHENRALLELFHACLSLGLTGSMRGAPDAAQRLEALRKRVFRALPNETVALAPPLASALAGRAAPRPRRIAIGALVALGLIAIGVYTASHLALARDVDAVFASMQQISGPPPGPSKAAAPAAAPRLAPLLAADASAQRLVVSDEAHRSIVSIGADQLFEGGSTHLSSAGAALLARVAASLGGIGGKVLVIGHTDGRDLRSARLPSAWHQSYEWAREAADGLGRSLASDRLAIEGAADLQAAADAGLPRRRVDIVLYP